MIYFHDIISWANLFHSEPLFQLFRSIVSIPKANVKTKMKKSENNLIWCPWEDSNPHRTGSKPVASANWATRARNGRAGWI